MRQVRALLPLSAMLGAACSLPEETKNACETDKHCAGGNVCVANVCRARTSPPAPVFTRFRDGFHLLERDSGFPGGVESPEPHRFEWFFIAPADASVINRGQQDETLDSMWFLDFVDVKGLKGGIDATSSGDQHQDLVARTKDDTVIHIFPQAKPPGWVQEFVGTRLGKFRPAISHLGHNTLVAFQVDAATGEVWFSRRVKDVWEEWKPGVAGKLTGGLDATTLVEGDLVFGAQLVGRDGNGQLVTATFDAAALKITPWTSLPEPRSGSRGQPTVFAYTSRDFDIFVSSSDGGVWRYSQRRSGGSAQFVQIGNGEGTADADLDASASVFDGVWRLAMLRRDAASGTIALGLLEAKVQ